MVDNRKQCTKCGEVKKLSDFYFYKQEGRYESQCKACRLAYQKQRHQLIMNDPNLYHKRLLTQQKYRERNRYKIAEKARLERRKNGISPQRFVNKDLLLKLYADGLPIETIANKCKCSKYTVKLYAHRNGLRRGHKTAKICQTCKEYPCFVGQENIESDFAKNCKKYKRINYKLKNKKQNEQQREQTIE